MKLELVFTGLARRDLEEIFWFIAADSPIRARTYVQEIEASCEQLCRIPRMGRLRPDLREGVYIFALRRRVVVVYELPENQVVILRIFSAGQDYESIMREDK